MRLVVACCAVLALLAPAPTEACSCASPRARGLPEGDVPRNTRVLLRDVRAIAQIELVELKTQRRIAYTHIPGVIYDELIPHGLLAAHTTYEVREAARVVTTFTTTANVDTTAPTFAGLSSELLKLHPNSCNAGQRPFIVATLARHPDDRSEDPLLAAVWRADHAGAIDFARPPVIADVVVRPINHEIWLGGSSLCSRPNITVIGEIGEKFAIQLVDLAGNRSSTMTFALTTDRPLLK